MSQFTHILPESWASYLINGDHSGLSDAEKSQVDAFLRGVDGHCVSCSEQSYFSPSNDADMLAGNVLDYYFFGK